MAAPNVLMIGTGEYTTGYVHGQASASDKGAGVVALTLFDLRRQGRVGRVALAGTNGTRFPGIREHFATLLAGRYAGLDVRFESFPADDVSRDPEAYRRALEALSPGDLVTIFTPDHTHFEIALAAVERGCHALVAKPLVKTLAEHRALADAARRRGVLVAVEVHKRWDPFYQDARDRIRCLGGFSFFHSYMSQPKRQLDTFRAWAGASSDISYYLNAHHVDFLAWALEGRARPLWVTAAASTGVATGRFGLDTEDAITLTVQWGNLPDGSLGTAVHTAAWIAPPSDVHSQQRFFYLGHEGEIQVDQAHCGYAVATDADGYASPNPLFMKYTPNAQGRFAGQSGYGYRSIEAFVDAVAAIRAGEQAPADFAGRLATVHETTLETAILEADRRSLDDGGRAYRLVYGDGSDVVGLEPR